MLVLVIGNFQIPQRASGMPSVFKKLLMPGKINHILCTGNLCHHDTLQYLYSLVENTENVHIIKGDYDSVSRLAK